MNPQFATLYIEAPDDETSILVLDVMQHKVGYTPSGTGPFNRKLPLGAYVVQFLSNDGVQERRVTMLKPNGRKEILHHVPESGFSRLVAAIKRRFLKAQ